MSWLRCAESHGAACVGEDGAVDIDARDCPWDSWQDAHR